VAYPDTALPKAKAAYDGQSCLPGMEAGIVALWQKCPHLGCRVPNCNTSQWFECPCHGSQYNQVGEKKAGPAPRGMDRFGVEVAADGTVTVNTGDVNQGPPIGTNTTGQEAQGPHCV
jgi:cytochrome b6-f complex iron-sulfur subunit